MRSQENSKPSSSKATRVVLCILILTTCTLSVPTEAYDKDEDYNELDDLERPDSFILSFGQFMNVHASTVPTGEPYKPPADWTPNFPVNKDSWTALQTERISYNQPEFCGKRGLPGSNFSPSNCCWKTSQIGNQNAYIACMALQTQTSLIFATLTRDGKPNKRTQVRCCKFA